MKRQGGYTLIEVGMALAISAALILLTFGLSATLARQRFQDTMTRTRALVQSQYESVRSGINTRFENTEVSGCGAAAGSADKTPGNSKCYIIGRLLHFTGEKTKVYKIVAKGTKKPTSTWTSWPDAGASDNDNLMNADLWYADGLGASDNGSLVEETPNEYGNDYIRGWWWNAGGTTSAPVTSLAILHSPVSNAVLTYAMNITTVDTSNRINLASASSVHAGGTVLIAFKNGGQGLNGAALCVDGTASSTTAVTTKMPLSSGAWTDINGTTITSNIKDMCKQE